MANDDFDEQDMRIEDLEAEVDSLRRQLAHMKNERDIAIHLSARLTVMYQSCQVISPN